MASMETVRAVLQPTRRRIVEYLYLHGPCQVGTLAGVLEQQVGSISHHLRVLERAGVVARAPELATDGRASWWRLIETTISWSLDDFCEDPAARTEIRAAERLNINYQLGKLAAWKRTESLAGEEWRRAAFSSDFVASATPEELAALHEALATVWQEWREGLGSDDAGGRQPVFVFLHGFPSKP